MIKGSRAIIIIIKTKAAGSVPLLIAIPGVSVSNFESVLTEDFVRVLRPSGQMSEKYLKLSPGHLLTQSSNSVYAAMQLLI
jgi:hypothetical protein